MFFSSHVTRHSSLNAKRGFALLITLTLIAFVVVLLVGLAAYTRVESAAAGGTQHQAQARQNALLALNVAVAQLQKYAGPDQRVTATADAFPNAAGTHHYTGVWDTTQPASPTPATWLVSGNEAFKPDGTSDPLANTPATVAKSTVELVGKNSTGTAGDVLAPLVDLKSIGVPGQFANDTAALGGTVIGRYAWWIGDQGVKAPVALADRSSAVNYAPFGDGITQNDLGARIGQQISLGAGAADATGAAVFEPRDTTGSPSNATLANNTTATNQLAFFKRTTGTVGLATLQQNFHNWSPNNFAVLANTKLGGLRQDLSLKPDLLGSGFAAWANYTSYMEDPANPVSPAPLPAYGTDPLRRRYIMQPVSSSYGIAPVLTYFYILLGVRKQNAASPYTLGLRWAVALSNLYSSALIPEDLRLEISGLPSSVAIRARASNAPVGSGTTDATVSLAGLYGNPLKARLPWDSTTIQASDRESWLPGRTYNWVSTPDPEFASGAINSGSFYSRTIPALANGLIVSVGGGSANGNSFLTLNIPSSTTLTIKLLRDSDGQLLATYTSPTYQVVGTTDEFQANGSTSPIGFIFRLSESIDTVATDPNLWLTTVGQDPRSSNIAAAALTTSPKSTNPTDCKDFVTVSAPDRLFDRDVATGTSYNEDAPLFELPRSPLLSLGELQHFYLAAARPFAIGNSWTNGAQLNGIKVDELFDRFFFSGLVSGVTPTTVNGSLVLPNPLHKVLRNSTTGAAITAADLQGASNAESAKFLLQGGAFNLNSVSAAAWAAVLRSVRFSVGFDFNYLAVDANTGTADDATTVPAGFTGAAFLRFPQSAQEVYRADDNYPQSQFGGGGPVINTPLYRRGVRTLAAADLTSLANAIVALVSQYQAANGPFVSLEQFLNPASVGNPSLLEQAIANANINANVAEFSSQFLTQGDIMTALAPVLFPRSDTFVVRTYGETVNPATGATEGRAWCEATVQRVPDYFDSTDPAETAPAALASPLNQTFGRRFKVVSFRWLTRSDI